ncbi:NADP-dependent oxidoreductase domain-containing protein [Lipomyces arxii]|uniref:NADP-dependent oxidoreductase domain-containing protein n=1 Tax=Lipomyces arxii TaxID=56418 RepID=UPI0034CD5036
MATKNRIILGCMTFGPATSDTSRITSMDETKEAFQYFKDRGYTEIDTARNYTGKLQESWTAEAGWKNYGFNIATKCWPNVAKQHSAEKLRESLEKSLSELKTDSVEVFYLHAPDRTVPFAETAKAMDTLHKEGKFKIFGISNFSAFEVAEIVTICRTNGWIQPTLYQGRYNCITRDIEEELIPALRHYGLDIVIFNPVAAGLFSGKYNRTAELPTEGRFREGNMQGSIYRSRYFRESYWSALDVVQPVAEKNGLTMLEIALRWMVHHSALKLGPATGRKGDGIIIGVSRLSQLKDDLDALEKGPLPEDVIKALDKAAKFVRPDCNPYWNGKLEYSY